MLGPKSVLVAEQDAASRLAYVSLLENSGYVVFPAASGEDAVALFGESRPDLVLLNLQMPGFGGHEILSVMKATDAADIPVIALTSSRWERRPLGRAGVVECLRTPCREDVVIGLVDQLIGPARLSARGCSLCADTVAVSRLQFGHAAVRRRVRLEIALCEACGDRVEKHLKRMIPKRLMQITRLSR